MHLHADALGTLAWFKSSYSNDQGGACLEGAHLPDGGIAIRDSKVRQGPAVPISAQAWQSILDDLKVRPASGSISVPVV